MKAIVTVIGKDQVGIIAAVCALLSLLSLPFALWKKRGHGA